VQISLLGPLKIHGDAGEIVFGAAKERSLVAALALSPGQVVSVDALIDALWGDSPPATARKTIQTYVKNIRRACGPDAVATVESGYTLAVGAEDVDVARFRSLVHSGEAALRSGATAEACEALREAVGLWRGDPLPGLASHTGLAIAVVRLREEYLSALEARFSAELAAGVDSDLVGELEALVREHPFRERLWAHLMLALYRSGRQADALSAFQRVREVLREELGLEPGGTLQRLESAILAQDPMLDADAADPASTMAAGHAPSPVRYATSGDGVHVAYQIVGDGPIDVLVIPGFPSHLDMWWDAPTDDLVRRLASISRLILFDKRGIGLSDRPQSIDWNDWVDDAVAVLDAAGSGRAVILGISAGSPTAIQLAATHPERTSALVLCGGWARLASGDGYDAGTNIGALESFLAHSEANWGTGVGVSTAAPSRAKDPAAREFLARLQRLSASPTAAGTFLRAMGTVDVRDALPMIQAPTLILHASRDQQVPVEAARLAKDVIPDATLIELDSDIHLLWLSDVIDEITHHIERFLDQSRAGAPR
jgi:DNA-binding SARP family transcriptional activator/pimeloyl-ACP methyl ester carboxylesterase